MRKTSTLFLACVIALVGCGGGSGGKTTGITSSGVGGTTGGLTSGGSSGSGTGGGSATNAAQWQVALSALSGQPAPLPLTLPEPACEAWDKLLAQAWPGFQPLVQPRILAALQQQIAALQSNNGTVIVGLTNLRNVVIDTNAAPGMDSQPSQSGATHFSITVPRAPGAWRLAFTVDAEAMLTTQVLGIQITAGIQLDVTVSVDGIVVSEGGTVDVTSPARPLLASADIPSAALQLTISSQDPLLQQLLGPLTQVLDPIVRVALVGGAIYAQQQVMGLVAQVPTAPGGPAGTPCPAIAGAPPLEPLAVAVSDEIQLHQMPWGTVLPTVFDQPGYGNGVPVDHYDHGDSCDWTGHYVASEALRYELTGDAKALSGLTRALQGETGCMDVGSLPSDDGLLSRCVIPMSDPRIVEITGNSDFYQGSVNGVATGTTTDVSRDAYLGLTYGALQTWLRVPSLKPVAAPLLTRGLDYMVRHGWNVYFPQNRQMLTRACPVAQASGHCWAMITAGATVDPARFGALRTANSDITGLEWLNFWSSSREAHESYYKFQLSHDQLMVATLCEADPGRYRDYLRVVEIARDVIGGHDNAHFDATFGAIVPSQAPLMGPRVKNELDHWALRDRRGFSSDLTSDPTIATVSYSSPLNTGGTQLFAAMPVPIEKRPCNDFLWQVDPTQLTGWGTDQRQYPGIDLVLPYWLARSYGQIP